MYQNAKNILVAARSYGLGAKVYRYDPDRLKEVGRFPMIVHWEFNHFIVLDGFKGDKVYVNDPARGTVVMTYDQFDEGYTGICLMFEPTEDFEPSDEVLFTANGERYPAETDIKRKYRWHFGQYPVPSCMEVMTS